MKYVLYIVVIIIALASGFGICWFWQIRPIEAAREKARIKIEELEKQIEELSKQKEEEIREKIRNMDPTDVVSLYLDPKTLERIRRDVPDEADRIMVLVTEFLASVSGSPGGDPTGSPGEGSR